MLLYFRRHGVFLIDRICINTLTKPIQRPLLMNPQHAHINFSLVLHNEIIDNTITRQTYWHTGQSQSQEVEQQHFVSCSPSGLRLR